MTLLIPKEVYCLWYEIEKIKGNKFNNKNPIEKLLWREQPKKLSVRFMGK